jgi:short-subunit dehydrogenase
MEINNKVAIVTGASSGIGLAAARLLSESGAKVVLAARSKDKLQKLSNELNNSLALPTDITDPKQIDKMIKSTVDHYGRIDILINNAGQGYDAPVEKIKIDTLQKIFNLSFVGQLIAMQKVIPIMRSQGDGAIINISSGLAIMHIPNMEAYAATKAALSHLSLTAREELKNQNINVGVVYPFSTDTDFEKNTIKDYPNNHHADNEDSPRRSEADSAEYVAQLILQCIKSGSAEVFAHEWMKR